MKNVSSLSTIKRLSTRKIVLALVSSLLLLSFIVKAQDPPQYGTPYTGVPDVTDVNMYQAHIRPYSTAGNLAGVIARLDAIKDLGINVIYVMPIYPHGTDSRSSNSPYCIKDFKDVAPEYGTLTDMRNLVDGAHSRGMAVILDVAINGTSWDHPWTIQHPDWYVQNASGVIQQLSTYTDVAALNFNNSDMRAAIVDALRYWVFAANVDGFRCDFADNPPLEFWTNTINNLRGITTHKLLMFAEGDRQTNFTTGFDMNFGNDFYYGKLINIKNGGSVVTNLDATNAYEYLYATGNQQVVRFTSNHDVEGTATAISTFNNHNGVVANFMVAGYMKGVPMLTAGQEVDFNSTIPWPYLSVKINWNANPGAAADFSKVLKFRTSSNAIRLGTMTNYSDANVCAFTKIYGTEKVVVMINMRNAASTFTIPSAFAGSYQNGFTGFNTTLTAGATQSLAAYQYLVFTTANVPVTPLTGVTVSPTSASVIAGLTQQLTPAFTPSNATNQTVTYASSNTAVATVSATGLVTAVAVGTANITVTTQEGNFTAVSAITVTPVPIIAVTGVTVSPTSASVVATLTRQLTATVLPSNATNKAVSWSSGNTAVATVSATGLVTAVATGTASITVTTQDGNKAASSAITVTPAIAVTGVTVSPTSASVKLGLKQQVTATFAPTNATNKAVTWTSSNTAVATVNSTGSVTTVALGTANITVTTQDGNKTAVSAITVIPATTFTVHFYKPSTWGTSIRIYWWSALPTGALADGTWPGVSMTPEGNGWYMYTFTNLTSTNLIFNDGTNQTADLSRTADGWYYNNTWYTSNPRKVTIVVTPYSGTYDGTAHTATGTAKSIGGLTLAGLDLNGTTHTNAGTYNGDSWTFTDVTGNYDNASGTVNDTIAKANATVVVTPYSDSYDGTAQTATGTVEGVLHETLAGLDLSGTTHTDAGDYPSDAWSFGGNSNYNEASGTVHNVINVAAASVTPDPAGKHCGEVDPAFTGTLTGFVPSDGITVTYSRTAGEAVAGSPYTISGVLAPTDKLGNYSIVYNMASFSITDITAPVISTLPAPTTINCPDIPLFTTATATDCSPFTLTYADVTAPGSCAGNYSVTRTWTAIDGSNNQSTASQIINVQDVTPPVIYGRPGNITLSACTATATWTEPTASDGCSGVVIPVLTGPAPGSSFAAGTTTIITYTATDACGNSSSCSFTVTRLPELKDSVYNDNPVLYYGYALDQTANITVKPTGGTAPYTVQIYMNRPLACNRITSSGDEVWTPGANTSSSSNITCPGSGSATLNPVSTSTNTINSAIGYTVTLTLDTTTIIYAKITDANGCVKLDSTKIRAIDVRCFAGNSGISKIAMCHATGSAKNPWVQICVDPSAVQAQLALGDYLGTCGAGLNSIIAQTSVTKLEAKVLPNPSSNYFTLGLMSGSHETIKLTVVDALGRVVEQRSNVSANSSLQIGTSYRPGIYFARLMQGKEKVFLKLIKEGN